MNSRRQSLPHSEECERAVLAGVLLEPGLYPQLDLKAGDFFLETHRHIWQAYTTIDTDLGYDAIDLRTLQTALEDTGTLDQVGGLAYLTGLDGDLPDLGRVVDIYAHTVRERAVRRRLIQTAHHITQQLSNGSNDGQNVTVQALETLEATVSESHGRLLRRRPKTFVQIVDEILEAAEERQANEQAMAGLSTGFPDWDARTRGLAPGEYWTVAGRPGLGKSTFAVNVACHVALALKKRVLFCSVEQLQTEIASCFMSLVSEVDRNLLRVHPTSVQHWEALFQARRELVPEISEHLILRDDLRSVAQISAAANRLKDDGGLDLVVVDYIHLLGADSAVQRQNHANRTREIGQMAWGLMRLGQKAELTTLGVSQMSRNSVKERRKPRCDDLRDSGELEQHSHGVAFLWRPPRDESDEPRQPELRIDDALLIVDKHRNGPDHYEIPLVIDRPIGRIRCKTEEAFEW